MELQAPLVVAVLVTCDPGPWFEEALRALGEQDYPNLSVVVVDAGSSTDPTSRVASILPSAQIGRLHTKKGYASATNSVLGMTPQATHLLLCHDDVAPAPDAVRLMVEEAYRSNAGIVTPKLVAWDRPDRILQVGMAMTRGGTATARVERGEMDQEQHDAVRDVFVAPGAFSLVRSDLFTILGGFDPGILAFGEDVDLSWRAHLLGARVIVAPMARVRHLEVMSSSERHLPGKPAANDVAAQVALTRRHQLRTVLKCYRRWTLLLLLPQLALLGLVEMLFARLTHRPEVARAISGSWRWNLARRAELTRARAQIQSARVMSDHELRQLQLGLGLGLLARQDVPFVPGWPGRFSLRGSGLDPALAGAGSPRGAGGPGGGGGLAFAGRDPSGASEPTDLGDTAGPGRPASLALAGAVVADGLGATEELVASASIRRRRVVSRWAPGTVAWVVVLALILFGSRKLATSTLPAVGQLSPWPGWTIFLGHYVSGWRSTGLGASVPAPLAFALIGLSGIIVAGHMGFLQHLAVLGTLPLGALGAWRLGRRLGSGWGRVTTMVVYAVIPLPYGALGLGRWDVLVAYAVAPWVLYLLTESTGLEPFGPGTRAPLRARGGSASPRPGTERDPKARLIRRSIVLAIVVALAGAFVPSEVVVVLVSALGLVVGSTFAGRTNRAVRALVVAVLGVLGAVILSVPWTLGLLHPGPSLAALGAPGSVDPASVGQLLALRVGGVGVTPLAWGLVAAALLPLLIGQGWRLAWASRAWGVAVACWFVAWLGGKGWLGVSIPTGVLLAGAAAAVALCVGLGVVAFQQDLVTFRFGWRQVASILAAAGVVVGTFSFLGAAVGGRWNLPSQGYNEVLSWMPACATPSGGSACQLGGGQTSQGGAFRVLWLGNPQALPMGSWSMEPNLAFATSEDGPPDATSLLPPGGEGSAQLLASDVHLAAQDRTSRLGHLLASLAVRYIVVPNQLDPDPGAESLPPPAGLLSVLAAQEDLLQLPSNPSIAVFANVAWAPERAELSPAATAASKSSGPAAALNAPLAGSTPVLAGVPGAASFEGTLPAGTTYLSASSSRWVLTQAGGSTAASAPAYGVGTAYTVDQAGPATLSFDTPIWYLLAIGIEAALWVLTIAFLLGWPRRWVGRGARRKAPKPVAQPG